MGQIVIKTPTPKWAEQKDWSYRSSGKARKPWVQTAVHTHTKKSLWKEFTVLHPGAVLGGVLLILEKPSRHLCKILVQITWLILKNTNLCTKHPLITILHMLLSRAKGKFSKLLPRFLLSILMYVMLRIVINIHAIPWVLCCFQLSSTGWNSPCPTNLASHNYEGIDKMKTSSLPDCHSHGL
jgi:hypothetical protein